MGKGEELMFRTGPGVGRLCPRGSRGALKAAALGALSMLALGGFGQEVEVRPNDRQRRAQLVRHQAQELGAGDVERG